MSVVMARPAHVAVLLTVAADTEPIQGWVDVNGHSRGRFHGWLELNDKLEQALSSVSSPDDLPERLQGLLID
jgi:hypothetical protein